VGSVKKIYKISKVFVVFFIACMLVTLAACGGSENGNAETTLSDDNGSAQTNNANDAEVFILRMGNTATYPSQPNVYMREFKEKIEAATDRIVVELYEASAFGGPNEMIQGLQSGAFQSVNIPSGFYSSVAPKVDILDLPFLFASPDECFWALNGDTPTLDAYLESQGLVCAGWIYESNRDILSRVPIDDFADLKGKNLRTYSSTISQAELTAFGANPIIMATGDVPMALQQGTIDGIQCGNTLMAPGNYYDNAKYLLVDAGTSVPIAGMFSKLFLDGLPQDLRDLVIDTAHELITTTGYEYSRQYVEDCYTQMIDGGVTVTTCPPEMRAAMEEAASVITEDFLKNNPDMQAAYDEIQTGIAEYRETH
jgi:C4-dicarboxylate-binding protein DctP